MVQSARARSGMPYEKRLVAEIVDAYNEAAGAAFKKKEDTNNKMAEANVLAHFCLRDNIGQEGLFTSC